MDCQKLKEFTRTSKTNCILSSVIVKVKSYDSRAIRLKALLGIEKFWQDSNLRRQNFMNRAIPLSTLTTNSFWSLEALKVLIVNTMTLRKIAGDEQNLCSKTAVGTQWSVLEIGFTHVAATVSINIITRRYNGSIRVKSIRNGTWVKHRLLSLSGVFKQSNLIGLDISINARQFQ